MAQLINSFDLTTKPLIGMIHLPPFPRPSEKSLDSVIEHCLCDVQVLQETGFDAILIENFHDNPFPKYRLDDYKYLVMSTIVGEIVKEIKIPFGINILRNACKQALIMAAVHGAAFIRCNVWEGTYITDQGKIESVAYDVIRKKNIFGLNIMILADVHVKHASPLGNFSLEEASKNALIRGKADAIIVSGRETGSMIHLVDLQKLYQLTGIKPILGSGLTSKNVQQVFPYISGAIVGTFLKNGDLSALIDQNKAEKLSQIWKSEKDKKEY
ncbi:BtpA/SgcQ family protein [Candidatus Hodarchaeum mangrovi]